MFLSLLLFFTCFVKEKNQAMLNSYSKPASSVDNNNKNTAYSTHTLNRMFYLFRRR